MLGLVAGYKYSFLLVGKDLPISPASHRQLPAKRSQSNASKKSGAIYVHSTDLALDGEGATLKAHYAVF